MLNREVILTIKASLYKIFKKFAYDNLFLKVAGSLITEMSLKNKLLLMGDFYVSTSELNMKGFL